MNTSTYSKRKLLVSSATPKNVKKLRTHKLFSGMNFKTIIVKLIVFSLPLSISYSGFAQKDTIHVIFKTHLDIGYTDLAPKVVNHYMTRFFPKALRTARDAENDGQEKFIWTTGSWLIYEFLRTASPEKKAEMESAIRDGLITWNAYPFTFNGDLLDRDMWKFALSITKDLDNKYGKKTIAAKMTDVMGETIGALGVLNEAGIKMLHIGTNDKCKRPDTPPVFLWKDGKGNELIVIYENIYGGTIIVPGFNHILHFEFTLDNLGPQTPEEVKGIYSKLHRDYPNAVIMASTMDRYTEELLRIKDKLPVITSEIGSTWIYSAGTDPMKYASLRALMRLRSHWLAEKRADPSDEAFQRFSTNLLLASEHTGGLSEGVFLDHEHWTPAELEPVFDWSSYQLMIQSWDDSRAYLQKAVDALGDTELAAEARVKLVSLVPVRPSLKGFNPVSISNPLKSEHFEIKFDNITGAIVSLIDREENSELVNTSNPIGSFWHESFSDEEFRHWLSQYLTTERAQRSLSMSKPDIEKHGAVSKKRMPEVRQAYMKTDNKGLTVLLQLQLRENIPTDYGLPAEIWVEIGFPSDKKEINYTLQWFNKRPCRLPEAYWFSMGFAGCRPEAWRIEKVDYMVPPLDVVSKGARDLHAFNRGIFYDDGRRKIEIESPDCPIVAPGTPSLLEFDDHVPDLSKGEWHFNLFNNKWATNFRTWYSDDAKFRFKIRFSN